MVDKKMVTKKLAVKKVSAPRVFAVSNFVIALCNESKVSITHLKLQKLLYYVQWRALAIFDKEMFENDFEAWVNWPVCKEIYAKYSASWFNQLESDSNKNLFTSEESWFISEVVEKYWKFNPWELVALTHSEMPWIKTREWLDATVGCNRIINKKLIKDSFKSKLK